MGIAASANYASVPRLLGLNHETTTQLEPLLFWSKGESDNHTLETNANHDLGVVLGTGDEIMD